MADIIFESDGTVTGTKLKVDGKDITKNNKVIRIYGSAHAPYRSSYDQSPQPGGVYFSYDIANDDGTIESKAISTGNDSSTHGVGQAKIKNTDQVTRFIGAEVDREINDLVDKIVNYTTEKKIYCPDKEILLTRSKESLKDMIKDKGIELS